MKKNVLTIFIVLISIIDLQSQNNFSDTEVINVLKECYSTHFNLWEKPFKDYRVQDRKLDSIWTKYCTPKFRKICLQSYKNIGADVLTYDNVSLFLNTDLIIENYKKEQNTFKISFSTYIENKQWIYNNKEKVKPIEIINGKELVKLKSIILVKVVKIKDKYLIDEVSNATPSWAEQ